MAFARMIMTAGDYLHTVCLLFIALGVLVVGWVVIMSPGQHWFTHNQCNGPQLPGGDTGRLETH